MDGFKSGLSQKMQAFLDYEKAAGRRESTYLYRLRSLDDFLADNYPGETELNESMVLEWTVRRENESPSTFNNRGAGLSGNSAVIWHLRGIMLISCRISSAHPDLVFRRIFCRMMN